MSSTRILYLVPDLLGSPGGIARYCQMVCRALCSRYFFTIVSLNDEGISAVSIASVCPNVQYIPCKGRKLLFLLIAIKQILTKRPDLILVGHPNFAFLGHVLAAFSRAKVVNFVYGVEVWEPLDRLDSWAIRRADRIISISHYTAQRAQEANGIPTSRVRILYNCLDPSLDGKTTLVNPNKRRSILTVGRISHLESYKGHDRVIAAMPRLLKQFPDLVYEIVGDGTGRARLKELAKQCGVSSSVLFHGIVSEEKLKQHYDTSAVFVMPSTHEGFGFVFIEAMAHGMPAVGGNRDATPEVIVDGKTGYLTDPTDTDEIANAISKLLADQQLRESMGNAAISHVHQRFGFNSFRENLFGHLDELEIRPSMGDAPQGR